MDDTARDFRRRMRESAGYHDCVGSAGADDAVAINSPLAHAPTRDGAVTTRESVGRTDPTSPAVTVIGFDARPYILRVRLRAMLGACLAFAVPVALGAVALLAIFGGL